MKYLVIAFALITQAIASAADGGFLFVTFKNESGPMSEQIYMGLSKDGRKWDALNKGEPVLVSTIGDKGVRDPYLLRSHDGKKFILIATDLSMHFTRDWKKAVNAGSKSVVIWESTDLVKWSEPRLVQVAPDDAGCTWAPEIVYDEEAQEYLVFWASTTAGDQFKKHRIWAARTKDFKTFGKPFIYIEKANAVIDSTIVHENGKYYRFTKDETVKAITMEVSEKLMGPWQERPDFSLQKELGYEGPACFLIKPAKAGEPGTWCMLLDYFSKKKGYQSFTTTDLASGQFKKDTDMSFPFIFRHGGVLALTAEEYARVKEADAKAK